MLLRALYADERVVAVGHAIWITLKAQLSD